MFEVYRIFFAETLLPIGFVILFTGCAVPYHKMSPAILEYTNTGENSVISYGSHFNVLKDFKNKRFAEKELQAKIKIVAFEITNLSEHSIDLENEVDYYQDSTGLLTPLKPVEAYLALKLSSRKYMPILFLSFLNYYWTETYGSVPVQKKDFRMIPIGILIGPLLTLYNVESTRQSNIKLGEDLDKYSPYTRIAPGGKKYVLNSFKDISNCPIHIVVKSSRR